MRDPFHLLVGIVLISSIYTFSVNGGIINGYELADYVAGYSPPYYAALWISRDSRKTGYWPAYHYGLFIVFLWFIAVPHYALKTRGRAGIRLAVGLSALLWVSPVFGVLGWWLYDQLPDLR